MKRRKPTAQIDVRTTAGQVVTIETDGQSAVLKIRDMLSGAAAAATLNALEASAVSDLLNSITAEEEDLDDDG